MNNQKPPRWAKNAVATSQGWKDPKTGELLISKRGLLNEFFPQESIIELKQNEELIENTFIEIEIKPQEISSELKQNEKTLVSNSDGLETTSNHTKEDLQTKFEEDPKTKRLGGRPKGSKNKTK